MVAPDAFLASLAAACDAEAAPEIAGEIELAAQMELELETEMEISLRCVEAEMDARAALLHLPCISPASPLHLPARCVEAEMDARAALLRAERQRSRLVGRES